MTHAYRDLEIISLAHSLDTALSAAEVDMTPEQAKRYNDLMELSADVYEKYAQIIIARDFDEPKQAVLEYAGDSEEAAYDVDVDRFLNEMESLVGQVPAPTVACETALADKFNTLKGEQDGVTLSDHDLAFALTAVAWQHGHSVAQERITGVINNLRDPNMLVSLDPGEHLGYAIHSCVQMDTDVTLTPHSEPSPAPASPHDTPAPSTPKR